LGVICTQNKKMGYFVLYLYFREQNLQAKRDEIIYEVYYISVLIKEYLTDKQCRKG